MHCTICHHRCKLAEGQTGRCGTRKNEGGKSVSVNYAQLTALALDPIEKKPLYRFYPGSSILSAGSFGCNMACPFCQNYEIAEARAGTIETRQLSPDMLVKAALSLRTRGNIGLAFTYNEPMIGFEYVRDAARIARQKGLRTVVVTNGCVSQDALVQVLPYIDAYNIDLKCFTPEGYRTLGGDLDMVKAFIQTAAQKAHVEVTTLVVPGLSDSKAELRKMAKWLAKVSPMLPYHITRFFPRKDAPDASPTDPALLHHMRDIAAEYLQYVFVGNV